MNRKYATLRERLNANSKAMTLHEWSETKPWATFPCRIWHGKIDKDGYGRINIRPKRSKRKPKSYKAHRVSLAEAKGVPVYRLNHCAHLCDNRPCIEPEHLWSTTNYQNVRDRVRKGRTRNGQSGPLNETRIHPSAENPTCVPPSAGVRQGLSDEQG